MESYVRFYLWYTSFSCRLVRLGILFVLFVLSLIGGLLSSFFLFLLGILAMFEVFFKFHIASIHPRIPVSSKGVDPFESFTKEALLGVLEISSQKNFIARIFEVEAVKQFARMIGITQKECIGMVEKDDLVAKSIELVSFRNGLFVTSLDVFAAYLLLTEDSTKLLAHKELSPNDCLNLLRLIASIPSFEEKPTKKRVAFKGEGIGEELVNGWTLYTKQYTKDTTALAMRKFPLLVGREEEFRVMCEILSKKENNNVLLVGDAGVGKDALVEALAYKSHLGVLSKGLNHKRIRELLVGTLIAGALPKDVEERLDNIIQEVSHAGNIIVYIPEFQNVIGPSHIDVSSTFLPYLKDGKLPMIVSMTPVLYKQYKERFSSLMDAFGTVILEEPDEEKALFMLFHNAQFLNESYHLSTSYNALKVSIEYGRKYALETKLPGASVYLLEDTMQMVSMASKQKDSILVQKEDVIKKVEERIHVPIDKPLPQEKELLLHLEDKLHERIINQNHAIATIAQGLRRIRAGLNPSYKPVSFLFLGPTGVGKTETAKALADLYFKGERFLLRLDMSEYQETDALGRLLGSSSSEGDNRGELTEHIRDHPFSLILLDEFEKADSHVLDVFLQVLDDGRLTDASGRTASFGNSIIIATSNAGSEFIREELEANQKIDDVFKKKLLDYLQRKGIFKPELLNRFDDIVIFESLGSKEVKEVVKLLVKKVEKVLEKHQLSLVIGDGVFEKVAQEGYDPQLGARPLMRYIQNTIEEPIAQKILLGDIKNGQRILVTLTPSGSFTLHPQ